MIINAPLKILGLAPPEGASKIMAADVSTGQVGTLNAPTIALTDPPSEAYSALPSGSIFKAELEVGNTTYYQLFIKP